MKKICFIIPFFYKWNNYANIRSNYEYLQMLGYEIDIFNKNKNKPIDFNNYNIVMLHGSGAFLTEEQFKDCNIPIISFGWSDPNLFNETHFNQGDIYCTNDLALSKKLKGKPIYFYNTACDKKHHKNLNLEKTNDILVYGTGQHKFVTNRNEVVDNLRQEGFKIKVFGRGWNKHSDTFSFIEGEELAKEICQSHILLDISNKTTTWPHRIFEASARGTPVLTYDREDTKEMFTNHTEILLYNGFEQLRVKLEIYLEEKELLKEIGQSAQKRCYKDHDINIRIQELLKIIKENRL